mgnify:CR=1 FL=1
MNEHWSYSTKKRTDKSGEKWHFVTRNFMDSNVEYAESPVEYYFRNDSRTYFGMVKFERRKDVPYMFEKFTEKVMFNSEFRQNNEKPESKSAWSKNWK